MAHEFVFTMQDLKKVVPPDRVILDGITLAFLPGAKIGVLGANGAGKSTLLKIMGGIDTDFLGMLLLPAAGLLMSAYPIMFGFQMTTGVGWPAASAILMIAAVNVVMTVFWLSDAAVKYRRPDLPALNSVRGTGETRPRDSAGFAQQCSTNS